MKTFEVSLTVECRAILEIIAESEAEARIKASHQAREDFDSYRVRDITIDEIEEIESEDEDES